MIQAEIQKTVYFPLSRELPVRIAVFRALQLGDLLCTVPVFRALRAFFPKAHVTLISLSWAANFVQRFPAYLDDFMEFPGYPGLPETRPDIARFPEFIVKTQKRKFDLSIQLHGSGSYVNSIVMLFGARRAAGFYREGEYKPGDLFFPFPDRGHEVTKYLELLRRLNIPLQGDFLEFPLNSSEEDAFNRWEPAKQLNPDGFVCIHPGARRHSRRWPAERFARVADEIAKQGLQVVLTGTKDETPLVENIVKRMGKPCVNLAGRTSLESLGCLLKRALFLICNDTGISHLASALKVPSLVLVMGSDPERWAPLERKTHHVLSEPIACRPCFHEVCPLGFPCAKNLQVKTVLKAAQTFLERYRPAAARFPQRNVCVP